MSITFKSHILLSFCIINNLNIFNKYFHCFLKHINNYKTIEILLLINRNFKLLGVEKTVLSLLQTQVQYWYAFNYIYCVATFSIRVLLLINLISSVLSYSKVNRNRQYHLHLLSDCDFCWQGNIVL